MIVGNEFLSLHLKNNMDSSTSISKFSKTLLLFVLVSSGVCISVLYFSDPVRNQTSNGKDLLDLTRRRLKFHQRNMSREYVSNFG